MQYPQNVKETIIPLEFCAQTQSSEYVSLSSWQASLLHFSVRERNFEMFIKSKPDSSIPREFRQTHHRYSSRDQAALLKPLQEEILRNPNISRDERLIKPLLSFKLLLHYSDLTPMRRKQQALSQ
jgi:hypothetical protein